MTAVADLIIADSVESQHVHTTTQVTGLDAALAGKADGAATTTALAGKADAAATTTALATKATTAALTAGLATKATGGQPAIADLSLASTGIGAVDIVLASIQGKVNTLLAELRTSGLLTA